MSVVGEILLLEQASSPVTSDKAGYADADVVAYGVVVTGNVFLEAGSGVIGRI